MAGSGLYANIAAKKRRIAAGSGEKMRKKGSKGSPTKANFVRAAQTARKNLKGGGKTMGKVASDETKAKFKKLEKRKKAAGEFSKKIGRSFGSIMREKYRR